MKGFKIILKEIDNTHKEIHFVLEENDNKMYPIHKTQYEELSDKEKNFYMPSEFCINVDQAKELINDLISILPYKVNNNKR